MISESDLPVGFGPFAILSLFYAVIGVRFLAQLARSWRPTFDRQFTQVDRWMVDQAAFFILVPISVALHELGHAVTVWYFGGNVTGFGFFVFAGYVSYEAAFTHAEEILVASAGTAVNIILIALALAAVLFKRPPFRAVINELLLQFAIISFVNSLIFYPLLDFATGLEGDFHQMYFGHDSALSAGILAVHLGLLALGWWLWKSQRMNARFAALTQTPRGAQRRLMGGLKPARSTPPAASTPAEHNLREAAARVASGWTQPVQISVEQPSSAGPLLTLAWTKNGQLRAVVARLAPTGQTDLLGAVEAGHTDGHLNLAVRARIGSLPSDSADALTIALREAMETVDAWPNPPSGRVEVAPSA